MKSMKQKNKPAVWLFIFCGFLLFFAPTPVAAEANRSGMSSDETLVLQAVVRRVSLEENTLYVGSSKAKKVRLLLSPHTELIGVSAFADLKRGQLIKVWYNRTGGTYNVLKLELLPELGC